ncbi:segregation/condensation protein A [Patescibacteria group bacterium]|nr:MAG: segregation/condensation protein A [Patescibacteria group bacterium]
MDTVFSVKTPVFEGPLDLLLSLIEDRKLLISDVSLTKVADDFIGYIQNQVAFPVGTAANFILVSATLLLLKSRALLPVLSLTKDEEGDIKDLEFRLKLYQLFRNVATELGQRKQRMFFGSGIRTNVPVFTPPADLSIISISEAISRALQSVPQQKKRDEISVKSVISLEEMIDTLSERISRAIEMTFSDFTGNNATNKKEVVIGFLAMLELFKRGMVLVEQDQSFGDIRIAYNGSMQVPRF